MQHHVRDLVEVVNDHERGRTFQRLNQNTGGVGGLWNRCGCEVGGEVHVAHARQPIGHGFKERTGTFPILTPMVEEIPSMHEALNQF